MIRDPVSSSNLKSVGYDPVKNVLEIAFHSGGVYQYSGVPSAIHQGLMYASSKGQYFSARIKNSFPYHKIN